MFALKFGVIVPTGFLSGVLTSSSSHNQFKFILSFAKKVEELGYDSIWVVDHLLTYPFFTNDSVFECWTILSVLANEVKKLRLGPLVTCNSYRHPSMLAKIASCVDVISNGRLILGIGGGWFKNEYAAYGFHFPNSRVRSNMLRESIEIIKGLYTKEKFTFKGEYYSVSEAILYPKPVQKPHPPILIGGVGEKYTLKLVAELADIWNLDYSTDIEETLHKMDVLKDYCSIINRKYNSIEKTIFKDVIIAETEEEAIKKVKTIYQKYYTSEYKTVEDYMKKQIIGTPSSCTDTIQEYIDIGIKYFMLYFWGVSESIRPIELFIEEVKPNL